jgi:hypothetical protein
MRAKEPIGIVGTLAIGGLWAIVIWIGNNLLRVERGFRWTTWPLWCLLLLCLIIKFAS